MATTTLSSKVLQAAFAYEDTGVAASGTFTANADAVVGISGTVTGLGDFAATIGETSVYNFAPADPGDAADLAAAAVAIIAAINEELNPTPTDDDTPADDTPSDGE
jgi:hypothetical protein